jgi:hypothetical protein
VTSSFARLALISTTSVSSSLCCDWTLSNSATLVKRVASRAACSLLKIVALDGLGALAATMVDGISRESTFQSSCAIVGVSELG